MNLFILDKDINKSVGAYVDKHISKMVLESAQLLCGALHINTELKDSLGVAEVPYKLTHKNHPVAVWVRSNKDAYTYTAGKLWAMSAEYTRRYGREHLSFTKMKKNKIITEDMYHKSLTLDIESLLPSVCMPDEYKSNSVIESYRNYYRLAKKDLHTWTNTNIPEWI